MDKHWLNSRENNDNIDSTNGQTTTTLTQLMDKQRQHLLN